MIARRVIAAFALVAALGGATRAWAVDTEAYGDFASLRARLLSEIGAATRSIKVASPYLTDGEFVTALFLAQYRKVDVQVLLGRERASHYLSRLNYLKSQNIPVFLIPADFKPRDKSALVVDGKLLWIDGDLDSLKKTRRTVVSVAEADEANDFVARFTNAVAQAIPAVARATPLVGKARFTGAPAPARPATPIRATTSRPAPAPASSTVTPPSSGWTQPASRAPAPVSPSASAGPNGAYDYNRSKTANRAAPEGVATRLPRETIVQKRERQKSETVEEPK